MDYKNQENQKEEMDSRDDSNSFLEVKKEYKNEDVKHLIKNVVLSVLFFLFSVIMFLGNFKLAGNLGDKIFYFFYILFGWMTYLIFIFFGFLGYSFWIDKTKKINIWTTISFIFFTYSINTFTYSVGIKNSGSVGKILSEFLEKNFGNILPSIIALAVAFISLIFIFEKKPSFKKGHTEKIKNISKISTNIFSKFFSSLFSIFKFKSKKNISHIEEMDFEEEDILNQDTENKNFNNQKDFQDENYSEIIKKTSLSPLHSEILSGFSEKPKFVEEEIDLKKENDEKEEIKKHKNKSEKEKKESVVLESKPIVLEKKFNAPSLSLLNSDSGKSSAGDSKLKMNVIQKVLNQFNIPVEMGEVVVGPSVTQFTLKPAQGVNVKKILNLKDNLQMALSATNMHIEAPIPGKPFVGIEIPNEKKQTLGLRSIIDIPEFQNSSPLALCIGKDIVGNPVISDLAKMPHLLVAGATGTGKSVTLHNLILSLLYKNSPYDLKLIILDPKRVEFTSYNSLPHLYTPIIKDPKNAIKSLNWAAQEMDRRYDVLGEYGVPNIGEYNKKIFTPALEKAKSKMKDGEIVEGLPPKMPFVVIIFDEYNDFMLSYPKEITPIITSLTQKARAAGIHLILATQRPDVKVITGTIKANIPARIALKTTSQIDSRTILDQAGAEDLLGNGDMLYMNGSHIIRVQAPFVSSEEVHSVIKDIKKKYEDFIPENIEIDKIKVGGGSSASSNFREMMDEDKKNSGEEPLDDEDYASAKDYVISTGKASTSSLQTAFRWGYNKAARIINDLENFGIVSPSTNGRNREVLINKDNTPRETSQEIKPENNQINQG